MYTHTHTFLEFQNKMRFPGFYLKGKQISTEQSLATFSSMQTLDLITSDTK